MTRFGIRPEARAQILRWRETLIGGAVAALGLWWVLTGTALMPWIGGFVSVAGAALAVAGVQRARFRRAEDGPGLVRITEGRIGYFGPLTGGVADLETLTALSLDPSAKPAHWLLERPGEPALAIPVTASGAEALFDAFETLPGLRTEHMLRALETGGDLPVSVWRRPDPGQRRLGAGR